MPLETLEAFRDHGEVRGDTVHRGRRRRPSSCSPTSPRPASTTTMSSRRSRPRASRSSRDAFDELIAGIEARRGELAATVTTERRELVARIWSRDPTVWTGKDEARWLGWLDEPFRMLDDAEPLLRLRRGRRRRRRGGRAARDGRLVARARGAARARSESRASTSSTRRTRRRSASSRRSSTSSARSSSPPRSRARRSRRARTPTTSGSSRRAATSGRRSPIPARSSPSSRTSASSRRSSRASRRSAAATRRSRRSGSSRPRLMGIDVVGLLDRATRDGRRLPARRGQPGPRARARARRGAGATAATRCACPTPASFGALGRAADRRVDRQAGQGARAGARAISGDGPDRQAHEVRLPDPLELGQEFFRWEFATAIAGVDPRDQPVRPARRPGREGQDERGARGGRRHARARGLDRRAARRARRPPDYVCIQAFVEPDRRERGARIDALAGSLGERSGCVVTHGFGPRYLHSTGQLHKGGPNTGLFLQVVEDYGAGAADPRPAVRLRAG